MDLHDSYILGDVGNCRSRVCCYESRKREMKIRLMNEGRYDERLKARVEESTSTPLVNI